MYWSAITARLLVGMFTPAIRAKTLAPLPPAPVAGIRRLFPSKFLGVEAKKLAINANTTPSPHPGARHRV
jgi:hypothetical protein